MHPHLKRGLDLDLSPVAPTDRLEDDLAQHRTAQDESAKRRRVEAIALHCLRGGLPLILTARLRGPFGTSEWQNPWAEKQREGLGGPATNAAKQAQALQKTRSKAAQLLRKTRSTAPEALRKTRSKAPEVPSPEASRAVGYPEHLDSQPELEPLPPTAPIPDDDDHSGGTQFFSVDTQQSIVNNSPTNPFWLRRSATNVSFPDSSRSDASPSRIRKRDHRCSPRKSLKLAPPKEPLGRRQEPMHATPPDERPLHPSALMHPSSVTKPATIKHQALQQNPPQTSTAGEEVPDSSKLREDSAQEEEARSSQAAQYAHIHAAAETPTTLSKDATLISPEVHPPQPPYAQSFDSLVPATTYKMPSTVLVPHSSPIREPETVQGRSTALSPPSQTLQGRSLTLPPPDRTVPERLPQTHRHNLIASPAPDSSTGFMYRRVGLSKSETHPGQKTKPRAVSFTSSPAKKRNKAHLAATAESVAPVAEAPAPENLPSIVLADAPGEAAARHSEDERESQEGEQQSEDRQDSYRLRQSQYSTQAAMLLAQLEFQEDSSQSSTSSLTLRPWSQPAQNTPPTLQPQPSPAITPLSVFNTHTGLSFGDVAVHGALEGPPISTQDLFNAASPFAFSTVKKTSQHPRRSSMRFALAKLNGSLPAASPTPLTERVPLKEKNTGRPWSAAQPKPASQSPRRATRDVELPQLDFCTSLDFGPNADFTDYFLKGLGNEP